MKEYLRESLKRARIQIEEWVLWVIEETGLLPKLERMVEWASGKLLVIEAEKTTIRAFVQDAIDEDLPEEERGGWDTEEEAWGEDAREHYLRDPDRSRDQDEDR